MLHAMDEVGERKGWSPCWRCRPSITVIYLGVSVLFVAFFLVSSLFLLQALLEKDDTDDFGAAGLPEDFDQTEYWFDLIKHCLPIGSIIIPDQPVYKALQWMAVHDPLRPVTNTTRMRQRFALASLYFHWAGPSWNIPSGVGWLQDATTNRTLVDECSWEGIRCNQYGDAIGLQLDNELFGTFGGKLPPQVGYLTSLETLVLPGHNLYGNTDALNELSNLRKVDLSINRLTNFDLENKPLRNMRELLLSANRIKSDWDASILRQASDLRALEVNGNPDLRGQILSDISSFTNLETLNLVSTSLQGTLPDDIGKLTQLKTLLLGCDSLTSIPKSIAECTNLENFRVLPPTFLPGTGLTGGLITEMGRLTNLRVLDIRENRNLDATIPTEFGRLTNLNDLVLRSSSIKGTLPSELGNIGESLSILVVDENPELTGTVPTELAQLSNLDEVSLVGTSLSGTMPKEVCDLGIAYIGALCFRAGASPLNANAFIECACCTCFS